jgi:CMP-2-keto-3-deoxyoctulosonic acid synthetase
VATDDERIFDVVKRSGGEAVMTSPDHRSGSDRIAEVAETLSPGTIIVNVQGDEPTISPYTIDKAVNALLSDNAADVVTTSEPIIDLDDIQNGNVVKVCHEFRWLRPILLAVAGTLPASGRCSPTMGLAMRISLTFIANIRGFTFIDANIC